MTRLSETDLARWLDRLGIWMAWTLTILVVLFALLWWDGEPRDE